MCICIIRSTFVAWFIFRDIARKKNRAEFRKHHYWLKRFDKLDVLFLTLGYFGDFLTKSSCVVEVINPCLLVMNDDHRHRGMYGLFCLCGH